MGSPRPFSTWIVKILPFVEEGAIADRIDAAYAQDPSPFNSPPHEMMAASLPAVLCPSDPTSYPSGTTRNNRRVGLTDYLGVSGVNYQTMDGVLFADSRVRFQDIMDGTSNTLALGERPPSPDLYYGWWYAGYGQVGTGSVTIVLGGAEVNSFTDSYGSCLVGPHRFESGSWNNPCDRFHYWSFHPRGAVFAYCDGSVRLLSYDGDTRVFQSGTTRSGGEL